MTASISWSPINSQSLCGGCSSVADKLRDVFGEFPITLTMENLDTLSVMSKMHDSKENPYDQLATAIVEYGSILVEVSY